MSYEHFLGLAFGLLILAFAIRWPLISAGIMVWYYSRPPDDSTVGLAVLAVALVAEVIRAVIRAQQRYNEAIR